MSGLGLQSFLHLWGLHHPWWNYLVIGAAVSVLYEWALDRHGWNLTDLRQRAYGQLGAEVLWALH